MIVQVSGLRKVYRRRVRALDGIDRTVPPGMFGLLGANGAGKTTLMRILAGLLSPSAGTVTAGGHDLGTAAGRRAVKRVLGYLPQDLGLYPELTGAEFLDYVALLKGLATSNVKLLVDCSPVRMPTIDTAADVTPGTCRTVRTSRS